MPRILLWAALLGFAAPATTQAKDNPEPLNFIFAGGDPVEEVAPLLADPAVDGVQILYHWKQLEPEQGLYDFSQIDSDLSAADAMGKKLWIQLQDRFFLPIARNLPDYLLTEAQYGGGLKQQVTFVGEDEAEGVGWVAMQWNPALRERFQALVTALAERFDGRIHGINLPETSADFGEPDDAFCDSYFKAELENALFARRAFSMSHVVQYINFFPCEWNNDHRYMERFFDAAVSNGFGLGGPDIAPWRRGQMRNAYPFFNRFNDELPIVAMAVQGATLTYTNPKTGRKFTRKEFLDFARDYLGIDVIFWTREAPWFKIDSLAQ